MLQANNIHKQYGAVQVLKGVDIDIKTGEIVSIVGSSGAGKSTLLHILGTLDKPDQGTINLNNTLVTGLSDRQLAAFRNQYIGFVFQFHHLLPEFTALENVCIPGWIANKPKAEIEERARKLLVHLGLEHRIENKPQALSGGEQQRVAVARALINSPRIIFADEPTGNLDSKISYEIMEILGKIHADGNTVILVTHEEDISLYAHRVIRLLDGIVETDKINANPAMAAITV